MIVTGPQPGHTFEFGMTVFVTDARTPAILLISHWRPVAVVAEVAAWSYHTMRAPEC